MSVITYNKDYVIKQLIAAKFTKKQAETIAKIQEQNFTEYVATKGDIQIVQTQIDSLKYVLHIHSAMLAVMMAKLFAII